MNEEVEKLTKMVNKEKHIFSAKNMDLLQERQFQNKERINNESHFTQKINKLEIEIDRLNN